jgi:predicted metal-binding membrane protein
MPPAVCEQCRCSSGRTSPSGHSWTLWCMRCTGRTGSVAAGAIVIAAGVYELTPLKRHCRRHCRESVRSGFEFGLYCVGSSIGLMLMFVALGVMSVTWMALIAVVILVQKLLPPRATIDLSLALAIVGLGILIVIAPSLVPGLTRTMSDVIVGAGHTKLS